MVIENVNSYFDNNKATFYEKMHERENIMKKYRKKPVIVNAYQTDTEMFIPTLEGTMKANIGDWIITGIRGEQYPCKPDVFDKTYEAVDGGDIMTVKHGDETSVEIVDDGKTIRKDSDYKIDYVKDVPDSYQIIYTK